MLTKKTKWRKVTNWLRREFPLSRVRVRQMDMENQAECEYVNHRFEIVIQKKQCFNLRLDALLHEWAHALTWHGNDTDDHGSEWGLAYAMLYRAWLTWNYGLGVLPDSEEN
jgi:hypothetical protein